MPQRQHPSFMQIDKQETQQQPKDQSFQTLGTSKQPEMDSFPVPDEIALRIASLLEVRSLMVSVLTSFSYFDIQKLVDVFVALFWKIRCGICVRWLVVVALGRSSVGLIACGSL